MTSSDWGTWLLDDIEDADPDTVAVWYLGCNGFVLKADDGTTVFIDPYLGTGEPPHTVRMIPVPFDPEDVAEADAVFGSHEHLDHVHGPSQAPILANTGADFYTSDSGHEVIAEEDWTGEWGVEDDQLHEITEGDTVEVGAHAGDARPGEFEPVGERYDIDLGVLAFGTVGNPRDPESGERVRTRWYNDENMVVEAANDLQLDRLLPSHWDMWKGFTTEPTVLHNHAATFPYPERLEIAEIGDRVDL
ncbi:MBL fold metallo-hydrolase [Halobacteriales archaeon QH_7_68_42]|nr:MAG: MBL fold metallo-hydrolase [Halobacteriales archaeon QH_7_68_42]